MKPKPDFYKKTIEKDEDEIAESVLTPEDVSTNERKIILDLKKTIQEPVLSLSLENSLESYKILEKSFIPSVFRNAGDTLELKMDTLERRLREGSSFLGTCFLLANINYELENQSSNDNASISFTDSLFKKYLSNLHGRIKKRFVEPGDSVVSRLVEASFKDEYIEDRNELFPIGSFGVSLGIEKNQIVVYFPLIENNSKEWKMNWKYIKEYDKKFRKKIATYKAIELEVINPTTREQQLFKDLSDSFQKKISPSLCLECGRRSK